jgi:hypothetical protein
MAMVESNAICFDEEEEEGVVMVVVSVVSSRPEAAGMGHMGHGRGVERMTGIFFFSSLRVASSGSFKDETPPVPATVSERLPERESNSRPDRVPERRYELDSAL